MRQQLLLHHLQDKLKLAPGVLLRLDSYFHIVDCLEKLAESRVYRFKAVMLTDELSRYNSFALGALYSDHLACLLVL